jgi:hypothetical protein
VTEIYIHISSVLFKSNLIRRGRKEKKISIIIDEGEILSVFVTNCEIVRIVFVFDCMFTF